jgi:hypothetical protein
MALSQCCLLLFTSVQTLGEIFFRGVYKPARTEFNTWGHCFPDSPIAEAEERELHSSADDKERKELST